jgi:hypothetical protein
MPLDLYDLFPKTIAVTQLNSLSESLCLSAIKEIERDLVSGNPGDGSFTQNQQLLDLSFFAPVKKEILELCGEFCKAYSHAIDRLHICNSWGNKVSQGDSIRTHKHTNSYISGSFYLTDGSGFSLVDYERSNLFGGFTTEILPDGNMRASESFHINPQIGRIIFFSCRSNAQCYAQ